MHWFLGSKRRWKRWAIGIGIAIAVLLVVNAVVAWWTNYRWQQRLAAIRAAGDPASIAELAPEPIPDDRNAAAQLEKLRPRLDDWEKEYVAFWKTPLGTAYEDHGEPPTADELAAIRQIVDRYPDVTAGLAQAAACDQYASLMDFSLDFQSFLEALLHRVTFIRTAARFMDWRMQLLLADGKPDEAVEQGIQLLRLARLHNAEPTLVSYLVGIAVRGIAGKPLYDALSAGPVSPELHAALDEELVLQDDPQQMVRVLRSERALSADSFDELAMSCGPDGCRPNWAQRVLYNMLNWTVRRYWIGVLDSYDAQLPLAGRPWCEIRQELGAGDGQAGTDFGVLARLLDPAIEAAYIAHARNLALMRALRIYNALTEYRDEHGHEAAGLDDLSLPQEATIDPFSGEPLILKHTDDGWMIYSVMTNGVDDGGDFKDLDDFGLAPPSHRPTE